MSDKMDFFFLGVRGSAFPSEFYGYQVQYLADGLPYDDTSFRLNVGWS
ncbi:MAG: hypothetical protein WED11_13725 [Natronospirillum sp.]